MTRKTIRLKLKQSDARDVNGTTHRLFTVTQMQNSVVLKPDYFGLKNSVRVGTVLSEAEAETLTQIERVEVTVSK